jgi:DNA phosphorothioation-dependent restriction protein DptG
MLQKDHDRLIELIVEYYNARENWMENNTKSNHYRYRKVMKEMKATIHSMLAKLQVIYHEKLQNNIESREKTGFIPKKQTPKDIDSISSSKDDTKM